MLYSFGACYSGPCQPYGGIVFKLAADGTETTNHVFIGTEGKWPYASLAIDNLDNLYGTASQGGAGDCWNYNDGCGTAFKIAPDGTFTKLHDFSEDDGEAIPLGSLVQDKSGNVYGTTNGAPFAGTVFRLAADGTETILYAFGGGAGEWPWAGPTRDKAGNIYGTTQYGGANNDGIVFKFAPDGSETVLHSVDGNDGRVPLGNLVEDGGGNLYGTTMKGGRYDSGTVFEAKSDGTFKILHKFSCYNKGGCLPFAGLLKDNAGNLWGTTDGGVYNDGTIFEPVR